MVRVPGQHNGGVEIHRYLRECSLFHVEGPVFQEFLIPPEGDNSVWVRKLLLKFMHSRLTDCLRATAAFLALNNGSLDANLPIHQQTTCLISMILALGSIVTGVNSMLQYVGLRGSPTRFPVRKVCSFTGLY